MDYLDPKQQFRHRIILLFGYVCIAVAITTGTIILLYEAHGFGLKNGTVIQSGLVFLSSQPHPATIHIDGVNKKATTNSRMLLPAGIYNVSLSRSGYRTWQRSIEVDGDSVEHFDYPFLFPTKLASKKLQSYNAAPDIVSQSPDRHWLLVQEPASSPLTLDVYDLTNPTKAATDIALPSGLASPVTTSDNWQFVDWADDNTHLLLQHNYDGKTEYILLDRGDPSQSLNLTTTLSAGQAEAALNDKKYNQYYLYDAAAKTLSTASLSAPAAVPLLQNILAYQPYGNNTILYVTDEGAPAGKVLIKLAIGNQTYDIHSLPTGNNYLLDLTKYGNLLYVAAGSTSDNKVYIYKDPVGQLAAEPNHAVTPSQVLHVTAPSYLSFSNNAQFIVTENATQFGVYDIENQHGYSFATNLPLDSPQIHAGWMDGDRLTYVSGGKLVVFDYDGTNQQVLMSASGAWLPAFASDYKYVYTMTPGSANAAQFNLEQTGLETPTDL